MTNIKPWISALRPRTLFLAVATTICGSGMAMSAGRFSTSICILTILTATLLQLLSNLANDLGDFQHGTDITGKRLGPIRAVQSGKITPRQMLTAIGVTAACSAIVGLCLIYKASQFMSIYVILLFIALGATSIWAAIKYTAGKNPYGYKGLGDVFSFLFFGPVSVVGTYFLHTQTVDFRPWLPAIALGFFTAAVLNINNMRDMENDKASGKITLVIRIGLANAKRYHTLLTFGGIGCFVCYSALYATAWHQWLYVVAFVPFLVILRNIFKTSNNKALDPYLKFTSMSAFLLSILFVVCINL
ncbi:1,4-dihydroxy-2-naphthoate octaprenyltransferase [Dysgonomonas sp. PH5-45]|uniref:1,4-dihydroxy-2-naphthoate octaprenyltransferase n=1 Tax=unclassified Dysgonomonas TaxID=2630389 RepID=UPI002476E40A|nr:MULTISPECIES: 1,4-dihydroxy-2-naphthoate octaprenyltransferase [unclassified Dysgonomonas]MDH6355228.1 1,4-dihydroxy-2-naphthoate octaprenyltransferase [Dysgonomonas sp. PH5-45]MDH6388149.1 1,4-dihydroxy-2-naphthoate octaprenyltransferase [Dysgonomonas sp. PH5-37]